MTEFDSALMLCSYSRHRKPLLRKERARTKRIGQLHILRRQTNRTMVRARTACVYIPDTQILECRSLKNHSHQNDCGYRTPRFCWHDFLRESTAEAFALIRPGKFDRRTKGRDTLRDRFSRDARTAPTRKNHLSPGNSMQSQGNANRFACGECLRCAYADFAVPQICQAAQAVSVEISSTPLGACALRKLALLRLRASNELFQGSAPSFVSGRNRTSAVPPVCELHSN